MMASRTRARRRPSVAMLPGLGSASSPALSTLSAVSQKRSAPGRPDCVSASSLPLCKMSQERPWSSSTSVKNDCPEKDNTSEMEAATRETNRLLEAKAIERWNRYPEMATQFLKSHPILVSTIVSNLGSERTARQLTEFYVEESWEHCFFYQTMVVDLSHDDDTKLSNDFTLCERYLRCYIAQDESFQRCLYHAVDVAYECFEQVESVQTRMEVVALRVVEAMRCQIETSFPASLSHAFQLLKVRLLEKYPKRPHLIVDVFVRLLIAGPLRNLQSYGITLDKPNSLNFSDFLVDISSFITNLTADVFVLPESMISSSLDRDGETQQLLASLLGACLSALVRTLNCKFMNSTLTSTILQQKMMTRDGLGKSSDRNRRNSLLAHIGKFLAGLDLFRSALGERHFALRMPVVFWNAEMIFDFARGCGYGQSSVEPLSRLGITGLDILEANPRGTTALSSWKVGHRKKLLKHLVTVQDAYDDQTSTPPSTWTSSTVACYLMQMGFDCGRTFFDYRVDGRALASIKTTTELRLLGVTQASERRRLMNFCGKLFPNERSDSKPRK